MKTRVLSCLLALFLCTLLMPGQARSIDFKIKGQWLMAFDYGQNGNFTGGRGQTGFDGKTVVHPRQIDPVNALFTPTKKEIAHAIRVLEAIEEGARQNKGAVTLDGSMLDVPMELRARNIIALAKAAGIDIGGKDHD